MADRSEEFQNSEVKVAEAFYEAGYTTFVLEYHREGQGVQRPTFSYPGRVNFDDVKDVIKDEIDLEQTLNGKRSKRKALKEEIGKTL